MPLQAFLNAPRRVFAGFAVYSFSMGNIFPRMHDIQTEMGVEEGALGLGLIGAPVGTLIALTFATPWIEKLGFRRSLLSGILMLAVFYAMAVQAPQPWELFLLLIPVGLMIGCVEIILNLEADRVEHAVGYRIMNRAHAFWSFGFFGAGVFGGFMAWLGVSPQVHLMIVVPIAAALIWLLLWDFAPAAPRPSNAEAPAPKFALPTLGILILVVVTLPGVLLEGGSIDWSAIYLHQSFDVGPFMASLGVTALSLSMFVARFVADGFVEKHGPVAVARTLLMVLGVGCTIVVFSPAASLSLLGFVLIGIGCSVMFPLAMSAAAQRTDRPAAINVAAFAQFAFSVFLLAPPILGLVAEWFGIRASFAIGLPLIVLSLWKVGALGSDKTP